MNINLEKIFYAVCILTSIFGGVAWLTAIDDKASSASTQVESINAKVDRLLEDVAFIKGSLPPRSSRSH